jgi:hypothetical protein
MAKHDRSHEAGGPAELPSPKKRALTNECFDPRFRDITEEAIRKLRRANGCPTKQGRHLCRKFYLQGSCETPDCQLFHSRLSHKIRDDLAKWVSANL